MPDLYLQLEGYELLNDHRTLHVHIFPGLCAGPHQSALQVENQFQFLTVWDRVLHEYPGTELKLDVGVFLEAQHPRDGVVVDLDEAPRQESLQPL